MKVSEKLSCLKFARPVDRLLSLKLQLQNSPFFVDDMHFAYRVTTMHFVYHVATEKSAESRFHKDFLPLRSKQLLCIQ